MRCLAFAIYGYLIGLLVFYTFAAFDTRAWDISYFAWAKTCDGGLLLWGALYYTLKQPYRSWVKWIYAFSYVRLVIDIQSIFTGVGVNNNTSVAIAFICLVLIACYLTWFDDSSLNKWLSKKIGL